MLGKVLLPWFGGGAAVWTVCLLFFQCALVGGYGYAALARGKPHAVLLAASLLCLPLRPSPADLSGPSLGILFTLARTAGAVYFLLAATSPCSSAGTAEATHTACTPSRTLLPCSPC